MPFLITNGADLNHQDNGYHPTILHSIQMSHHPEVPVTVLKQLITPQNVNMQQRFNGYMPLHDAAFNHKLTYIAVLIDNGADINIQGKDGATPLHLFLWARPRQFVMSGTRNVTSGLISRENIDLVGPYGTALHLALDLRADHGDGDSFAEMLLNHGASINVCYKGATPLRKCRLVGPLPEPSLVRRLMPDDISEVYKAVMRLLIRQGEDDDDQFAQIVHFLVANLRPRTLNADAYNDVFMLLSHCCLRLNRAQTVDHHPNTDDVLHMLYHFVRHTCLAGPGISEVIPDDIDDFEEEFDIVLDRLTIGLPSLKKISIIAVRSCVLSHSRAEGFDQLPLPPVLVAELKLENLARELIEIVKITG